MSQELKDFEYFRDNQLANFDTVTGQLDVKTKTNRLCINIGSVNEDGYVRVWCNGKLRMKHRLVYFLVHGDIPENGFEIDHVDKDRANNAPHNLRKVTKPVNNTGCNNRKFGKQLTDEQVHTICQLLANTNLSDLNIAKEVNRSRGTIRDIKTRRTRTKISSGYSWKHRE